MIIQYNISLLTTAVSDATRIPITVAQAVCSINESISSGDVAATLSSLKSAPVGIRSITDDCAATYQEKLAEAKQQKAESGT